MTHQSAIGPVAGVLILFVLVLSCRKDVSKPDYANPYDEKSQAYVSTPGLNTAEVTQITGTSARSGGIFQNNFGKPASVKGVCWSTSQNPTTSASCTSDGASTTNFVSNITSWAMGTTYYVRAYATNESGTTYGGQRTFTTLAGPTVVTGEVSNILATRARVAGTVTVAGSASVSARGVCYATTENPTTAGTCVASGAGTGSFTANLSGLVANTTYFVRAYATNSIGTNYGTQSSFTTISVPSATTGVVSNITANSATVAGTVTSGGGATVTARGICYSTSANPTITGTCVASGSGTGAFTANLTGLSANTTYFVRAYATSSAGTGYGSDVTMTTINQPTVTTGVVSNLATTSATVAGNVTADGGATVTARGICYATTQNPTISGTCVASGNGTGAFTANLTGLSSGVTYYARAYATSLAGTAYGVQTTFRTRSVPTVTVTAPSANAIGSTSASIAGDVTEGSGLSVTARGICYATTQNPTTSGTCVASGTGTGAFSATLTGLTPSTTYYVRAYATNSVGTAYSTQVSFTTIDVPTVTTGAVTSVTLSGASVGGNVTATGNSTVTARGICYATTQNPTISGTCVASGSGAGSFTATLTGLSAGTTYFVRAYATNQAGTAYGAQSSFSTLQLATVTLGTVSAITSSAANVGANVTSDAGSAVTQRGICYATTQNPTISDTCLNSGSGVGTYTVNLTGLTSNTTYYLRAFATSAAGTSYSSQANFTTLAGAPTVTTGAVAGITGTSAQVNGTVTADGGAAVTARGVCFATTPTPTISGTCVASGSGTGAFVGVLSGLLNGTTYYVRAYATNSIGTSYGSETVFATHQIPTVSTGSVSSITAVGASVSGTVSSDGGTTVTSRGFCVSTSQNPSITSINTFCSTAGTGVGTFGGGATTLSSLTPATTYYVRAYATNSVGTAYGNQVSFMTLQFAVVTTGTASSITATGATVSGTVTSDGGSSVTARGVCVATTQNPTTANTCAASGTGTGAFSAILTGLTAGTTYNARAFVTTAAGTAYGAQITFMTTITLPSVTTVEMSYVGPSGARVRGNVTSSGGATVTSRGACYSTTQNPSIAGTCSTSNSGVGTFEAEITGLSSSTLYYVRAFATNSVGTAYGQQISFTTGTPSPVTDIDGNVYPTVQIGSQLWMAANLKTTRYRNGTSIPNVTDAASWAGLTTGAWATYDNVTANNTTYGKLYNWYAVANAAGLCPTGWHVPTDAEWTVLSNFLATDVGFKMKSTSGWLNNGNGSNASGFNGLPGGFRESLTGIFYWVGNRGHFWSSTQNSTDNAFYRTLNNVDNDFNRLDHSKRNGFSVRCVKD